MMKSTRIFEREPGKDYRHFIGGRDITLTRDASGAHADIAHRWKYHSDGFEWGYGGSGPADLALNILGLFVEPPEAYRLHQAFKWDMIAGLPRDVAAQTLSADRIRRWINDTWLIWAGRSVSRGAS